MLNLKMFMVRFQNFNESISSVQGGTIDSNGYSEAVVCTYTGRIFGLSTRCPNKMLNDSMMNQGFFGDSNVRIDKLKYEHFISPLQSQNTNVICFVKHQLNNINGDFFTGRKFGI